MSSSTISERRAFWTGYQPGYRLTDAAPGSAEFFAEAETARYAREPQIEELVDFDRWRDCDVLEAGCGIATDGIRFARAGARYTGVDFSPAAIDLARRRFELEGRDAQLLSATVTELPFADESFDLVYSNGVIHHLPETQRVVDEIRRVLRPGGKAIVMVYHRDSLNYLLTIMVVKRLLAALLLVPGGDRAVARATGEPQEVLDGHRRLLREHGIGYLTDGPRFLSHNTDGPGNPLSKVYRSSDMRRMFNRFGAVETRTRYLNLRSYPFGERLAATRAARRLERRCGWHLWVRAQR